MPPRTGAAERPPLPSDAAGAADPIHASYGTLDASVLVEEYQVADPAPVSKFAPTAELQEQRRLKWTREELYAVLAEQEKVPVVVPLTEDEERRGGTHFAEVILNGWQILVPKGRPTLVRRSIAEILNQSMDRYHTVQAREGRVIDMSLVTPDRPFGELVEAYSDPVAVELIRRGAPIREY